MDRVHITSLYGRWVVLLGEDEEPVFMSYTKEISIDFAIALSIELGSDLFVDLETVDDSFNSPLPSPYQRELQ